MKHLLFQKANCNGYLKKVNDGRFIDRKQVGFLRYEYFYADTNNPNLNIECEQCGDLDFLKTYFVHKEKEFSGIVVGLKNIVTTGYLIVDTDYDHAGGEITRFSKQANETIQCAIVYYANNRKRYVSLENILSKEVENETR